MSMRPRDHLLDEDEAERDRRYGLQHDPDEELDHELDVADRIAEQASLPAGHPLARETARNRLGRGAAPYERPHGPPPARFAGGDHVRHDGPDGQLAGRVVRTLDYGALVEVDFGRRGTTVVGADDLDPDVA